MSLAAFRRLPAIRRRAHATLDPNLERLRRYFAQEKRLEAFVPEGGNVAFPRVPRRLNTDALARHLLKRYSTLVVPGRFFEAPRHIRISFGLPTPLLDRGLANMRPPNNARGFLFSPAALLGRDIAGGIKVTTYNQDRVSCSRLPDARRASDPRTDSRTANNGGGCQDRLCRTSKSGYWYQGRS